MRLDPGSIPRYATLCIIVAGALLRLAIGSRTGLSNDEAYYWCWSRHLDYWYYDQGPLIAWCLRASTAVLGDTPLGVRVCPVLLGAGTLLFLADFVRRIANPRVALWTVLVASTAPLLSVGAAIATYDAPQVFCWAGALWCLERAVRGSMFAWYATGLWCFFGNLAKIPMVFLPLGVLLACATNATWRPWLRTPHPWIAGVIGLSSLAALFLWNARHDNLYVLHTLNLGKRTMDAAPGRWLGDFLGGQALALGPGLFLVECTALWSLARRPEVGIAPAWSRSLWTFAFPMLLTCTVNALRSKVEINWPVSAHLAGLVAAAWWAHSRWTSDRKVVVLAALVPSMMIQCVAWWPAAPHVFGVRLPARLISKLVENRGWETLGLRIERERAAMSGTTGRRPLLASTNYKATSILSFLDPERREATCLFPGTRRNQFFLWPSAKGVVGSDYLVAVDHDPSEFLPQFRIWFDAVDEPRSCPIEDPAFSGPIKTWFLVRCRGFRGVTPNETAIGY